MVNSEENMMNLKDSEIRVNIGGSRTLTRTNRGNWHGCQKCDRKLHCVTLTNAALIPGLHANIFNVMQALQKGFQVTSEGKTLILKNNSTEIRFYDKMAKNPAKDFY